MSFRKLLFVAAGLSLFSAVPAFAQDTIDGWTLNRDSDSCALVNFDDAQTMTMMNASKGGNEGFGFVRPGLRGVKDGEAQKLQVSLIDSDWIDVDATGAVLSDGQAGYIIHGFPVSVFAEKTVKGTLRIRRGSEVIHTLPLDNLLRPATALMQCVKSL